jgi:uncharacterized protein YjbJ (UPF0337 family)
MRTQDQSQDWNTLKKSIKTKFSKLSDKDIEGLNGHMDQLVSKVQRAYSYSREKADQECKSFTSKQKKS